MNFIKPGINKRVCAFLIDYIIASIIAAILSLMLTKRIYSLVWISYIIFKDCFNGQGIGKYLVGIQVVSQDGSPLKPSAAIIRNIFMVIPLFPLIEYFIMLKDEQGKRLGDKVAKTQVTDLKPQTQDSVYLWISIVIITLLLIIQVSLISTVIKQHPELLEKQDKPEIIEEDSLIPFD